MKYILITGSPVNGYNYEGPFDNPTAAGDFARKTSPRNSKCWVAPIREPEEASELSGAVKENFSGKYIRYKDGNTNNYCIDNIELVTIEKNLDPEDLTLKNFRRLIKDIISTENKADTADTESYAASLPGIDHDILRMLDEEDIPL